MFGGGSLPITFVSVNAFRHGRNIAVDWKVQNGLNTIKYLVEKSSDGINFTTVSTTIANVTDTIISTYSWLDLNVDHRHSFYRIRGIDKAGSFVYSRIVKVSHDEIMRGISIYPNPVNGNTIKLWFNNMAAGNYKILVFDNTGQLLSSKSLVHSISSAVQTILLPTNFVKGVYQLEIIHPDKFTSILKVIK
jgi:hypothetical protein